MACETTRSFFIRLFTVFQNPKTWLFTFFSVAAHVFSNTGLQQLRWSTDRCASCNTAAGAIVICRVVIDRLLTFASSQHITCQVSLAALATSLRIRRNMIYIYIIYMLHCFLYIQEKIPHRQWDSSSPLRCFEPRGLDPIQLAYNPPMSAGWPAQINSQRL